MTDQKKCSKCDTEKPLTEFSKDKNAKDGLRSQCKQCANKHRSERREKNRAEREANPEFGRSTSGRKTCSRCREERPEGEFHGHSGEPDGLQAWCKKCVRQYGQVYETELRTNPETQREYYAKSMIRGAKQRAKEKSLPFDLEDHSLILVERITRGLCEGCGKPFNFGGERTWNSPSIDRIVPERGYVLSNVRVICWGLNSAFGNWGEGPYWEMAWGMFKEKMKRWFDLGGLVEWNVILNG